MLSFFSTDVGQFYYEDDDSKLTQLGAYSGKRSSARKLSESSSGSTFSNFSDDENIYDTVPGLSALGSTTSDYAGSDVDEGDLGVSSKGKTELIIELEAYIDEKMNDHVDQPNHVDNVDQAENVQAGTSSCETEATTSADYQTVPDTEDIEPDTEPDTTSELTQVVNVDVHEDSDSSGDADLITDGAEEAENHPDEQTAAEYEEAEYANIETVVR